MDLDFDTLFKYKQVSDFDHLGSFTICAKDGKSKYSTKQNLTLTKLSKFNVEVAYECILTMYIKNNCEGELVRNISLFDKRNQW